MKESKETLKQVKDIIVYDTSRKYFGDWTIQDFNKTYFRTEPISFYIGILSTDTICDALWKEMSYNPKRFGNMSPFKFAGKNSLYLFITSEINPNSKALNTLSKIQTYLSHFWNLALKYDETFAQTNQFKNKYITIANIPNPTPGKKPIPGKNYKMLGYIRNCLHIIASQNITDFGKKQYREEIIKVVKTKHPEINQQKDDNDSDLQKYLQDKTNLENAIWVKNGEILDTESRIDTLSNEYENPGDTSADKVRLAQQRADLEKLENELEAVKRKIKFSTTNTYQK